MNSSLLSNVTKEYLCTYHNILETMIREMTDATLTDSISGNFITQMIPHHQAAIEMSRNILRFTTNVSLQTIAEDIIQEQTKGIADLQSIHHFCGRLCNCERDLSLYQRRTDQIMQTMFHRMQTAPSDNRINVDFLREMIPHHMGAVQMSENALQYEICPELTPLLNDIITSQERGIRQMQRLLRQGAC